jgi:hypothetical protein
MSRSIFRLETSCKRRKQCTVCRQVSIQVKRAAGNFAATIGRRTARGEECHMQRVKTSRRLSKDVSQLCELLTRTEGLQCCYV